MVSPEEFIAALNDPYEWASRAREAVTRGGVAALLCPWFASPDAYEMSALQFQDTLRAQVDRWLATGRGIDSDFVEPRFVEAEDPSLRCVDDDTLRLAMRYVGGNFAQVCRSQAGLRLEIPSLFDIPHNKYDNPRAFAEEEATRLFLTALMSDWRQRVAKCRNESCATYFLLKKVNFIYETGTYCRACNRKRSLGAAAVGTKKKREIYRHELQLAAARAAWRFNILDEKWHQSSRARNRMVNAVNQELKRSPNYRVLGLEVVTNKWISQNRTEIGSAIRELADSNGNNRDSDTLTPGPEPQTGARDSRVARKQFGNRVEAMRT